MNNNKKPNTKTSANGKTMFRVVLDGVDYGYMTSRARREFFARHNTSAWGL